MSRTMNRTQLLAAELFNYSYANYRATWASTSGSIT